MEKRARLFFFVFIIFVIMLLALRSVPFIRKAQPPEAPSPLYKILPVRIFPFSEENALKEWEEKIFRGKVVYRIEKDQDLSYVRAKSQKAASALYYKIKLDARKKHPTISWKWNVRQFPDKNRPESLETENEDDFAARVYVIFPARFFTNSKVLEYIWSERLPAGLTGTSPYSKNIKLIVARSGPNPDGRWHSEERDIAADYLKVFARPPEYDIGAVAFMTNTEHTGTSADSMYDEISLGYKEGIKGKAKEGERP
jgi:hypothetical protein